MNKYVVTGALVVVIGGAIYFTRTDDAVPTAQAPQNSPVSVSGPRTDTPAIAHINEHMQAVHSAAKSLGESQSSVTSITVEQTQNAVDFNAPGAGTAQQKAGAAAAATRAYEEAKQRGQ